MVRMNSQQEVQVACRAVRFCYLCGKPLPARDSPGRSKLVRTEHVIPSKLLGDQPADPAERWPVTLEVHVECDDRYKGRGDDLAKLLHRISAYPEQRWPERKHVKRLGLNLLRIRSPLGGHSLPAFGNAQKALSAPWSWVRGIHAALYREYLAVNSRHTVLPPVPAFDASAGPTALLKAEELSVGIRTIVGYAVSKGRVDSLSAWGGQVSYQCMWFTSWDENGAGVWQCVWQIVLPGVSTWSRSVLPAGQERPWHGCYSTERLPDGATVLEVPKAPMRVEPL